MKAEEFADRILKNLHNKGIVAITGDLLSDDATNEALQEEITRLKGEEYPLYLPGLIDEAFTILKPKLSQSLIL